MKFELCGNFRRVVNLTGGQTGQSCAVDVILAVVEKQDVLWVQTHSFRDLSVGERIGFAQTKGVRDKYTAHWRQQRMMLSLPVCVMSGIGVAEQINGPACGCTENELYCTG